MPLSYRLLCRSLMLLCLCQSSLALAANVSGVMGPNINPDDRSVQVRLGYAPADNDSQVDQWAYRIQYQYAFNESFRGRLVTQFRKRESTEYEFARAELLYNFKKAEGDSIWSSAVRFDIRTRRGDAPEEFAINWGNQWDFSNNYRFRATFIVATEFNADVNGQPKLQSRFALTKKVDDLRYGIELFDNIGRSTNLDETSRQRHQIGPSIEGKVAGFKYHARYLAGIGSRARDHSFLIRFTKQF